MKKSSRTNGPWRRSRRQSPRGARSASSPPRGSARAMSPEISTSAPVIGEHQGEPGLRRSSFYRHEIAALLEGVEQPGERHHEQQEAHRSPHADPTEGAGAGAGGDRERDGHAGGKQRRREGGQQRGREQDRGEALDRAEGGVAGGGAEGEQHQHPRAQAGAVREVPPHGLGGDPHQREHGEHRPQLRSGEARVLDQVDAEEREEDAEPAEAEEPDQRDGFRRSLQTGIARFSRRSRLVRGPGRGRHRGRRRSRCPPRGARSPR